MSSATPTPYPPPPRRMRSTEELEYFLNWLPTSFYAKDHSVARRDYLTGVRNAVEWVLGRQHSAPVSCRHSDERPSGDRVWSEQHAAHDGMAYGARQIREDYRLQEDETRVFGLQYFTGVENTLGWVLGWDSFGRVDEDWPWPVKFDE